VFRVLLIDDNPYDRVIARAALERNLGVIPHEIVEAEDGWPGILEYKKAMDMRNPFNLVVTDFMMVSGAKYVLEIIRIELQHKQIPVVVVSACTSPVQFQRWAESIRHLNPTAFLDKLDFSWEELGGGKGPKGFQDIVAAAVKEAQQMESKATSSSGVALDQKRMPPLPPGLKEHHKARPPAHLLPARVRH